MIKKMSKKLIIEGLADLYLFCSLRHILPCVELLDSPVYLLVRHPLSPPVATDGFLETLQQCCKTDQE
jgi:hypothetical protein